MDGTNTEGLLQSGNLLSAVRRSQLQLRGLHVYSAPDYRNFSTIVWCNTWPELERLMYV